MASSVFARALKILAVAALASVASGQMASAGTRAAPASASLRQNQETWRAAMARVPQPKKGCFKASYPALAWQEVACIAAPRRPYGPTVGGGIDFTAQVSGTISSATGSFDTVSGVTDEEGFGNVPNTYSLQLNASYFTSTAVCAGASVPANCQGWEQFIYTNTGSVFIEYWLIHYGPSCPPGWTSSGPSCWMNGPATAVPVQPLSNLGQLTMTGTAGAMESAQLFTGSNLYTAPGDDSIVNLAQGWKIAEYNIFGDGGQTQAVFNPGSTIVVRTTVHSGTMMAPMCQLQGYSAESNNLSLVDTAAVPAGPAPAVVFTETNIPGGLPGCAAATGIGDTHLTTFNGLLYDFQATGDFVLAQAGSDFTVQTRQASGAPTWPNAAVNTAVAARVGAARIAICLAPARFAIDGKSGQLADGQSLALPGGARVSRAGNVYVIADKSGDYVRAELDGSYINVAVGLGHWPQANVHGLLANANGNVDEIARRDGTVLHEPVSFAQLYGAYAQSWRVTPNESLLTPCGERPVESSVPLKPFYAGDLDPRVARRTRAVCVAAGVKGQALLDACTLDVAVLGRDTAAKAFADLPPPVAVGQATSRR